VDDGSGRCIPQDPECPSNAARNPQKEGRLKEMIKNAWDGLIWMIIPSAVGIDFGISGQVGLVGEAGYTPIDVQILYNWRAHQLSILTGSGSNAYLGSPTLLGGNGYVGITTVYGASDNQYMAGPSRYAGVTASADVIGKAGVNKIIGYSATFTEKGVPVPFIDPKSGVPVTFRETNITGGGNLFPDGIDIGIFAGESTSEIKASWP